jgi:hypothetical protein
MFFEHESKHAALYTHTLNEKKGTHLMGNDAVAHWRLCSEWSTIKNSEH